MSSIQRKKDGGVEAPISLNGLFFNPDEDDEEEDDVYRNIFETQTLHIGHMDLKIRQSSWHKTNANKVWSGMFVNYIYIIRFIMIFYANVSCSCYILGTFLLAEFIKANRKRYSHGRMLELGSATGALAIFLRLNGFEDIITR